MHNSSMRALYFRGPEKVNFLKSLGVDHVVNLSQDGIIESVRQFLKARKLKGVDVLYDPVGGKLTKESMKLLNWGAHILVIGFASGEVPVIPANIALVKVSQLTFSQKVNSPLVLLFSDITLTCIFAIYVIHSRASMLSHVMLVHRKKNYINIYIQHLL